MTKAFLFDSARCIGCYACQLSCKEEHCGVDWLPNTKAQPETGQFWIKIIETERGQFPKVLVSYTVRCCMQCGACQAASHCVSGAFVRRDDGLIYIDPTSCTGCMECIPYCPYDAVFANTDSHIAQKCSGCAHLLDDGWAVPRCVESCSTEALRFGDETDFNDEIAAASVLKPEAGTSPHFYFLNLPMRFITGEIYDEEADEVLIGVEVTLVNNETEDYISVTSDDFGDFWFVQVDPAQYTLYAEAEGYLTRVVEADVINQDLNVGAIAMYRDLT